MKPLSRNISRSKIGIVVGGSFIPKIMFNFHLTVYVNGENLKVYILQILF